MRRRRKWRPARSTLTVTGSPGPVGLVGGLRHGATRLRPPTRLSFHSATRLRSPCLYSLWLEAVADRFDRGDPAPDGSELGAARPHVFVARARFDRVRTGGAPHAA